MTIDEAIKVLELMGIDIKYWKDDEGERALKLGIEALKLELTRRQRSPSFYTERLPGETEG